MYLFENPVLQRELLVNLRMTRAFILLLFYLGMLGLVVLLAWPQERQLDLTTNPRAAQRLVNLVFLGQYLLASMMAPSFAAGAITGEKERKSYEMLLASPLAARRDRVGKAAGVVVPFVAVDLRLAADRDAVPAAGGRFDLRGVGGLPGTDSCR